MASTLNPAVSTTQKSERITLTASGPSIVQTWLVPSASVATFEASYPLGLAHGTYTTATIQSRDKDHIDGEDGTTALYKYTLNFQVASSSGILGVKPPGTVQVGGSSNAVDIPIERHPSYVTAWADTKRGVDSYISPQPTWRHSETFDSAFYSFTESALIDGVGKIANVATLAAANLTGASSGKWLMVDKSIQDQGAVVEVTRVWQYAANGWDTDIYENE